MTKKKTHIEIPITMGIIRRIRRLYSEHSGGWPIRMEHDGAVALYPAKNPHSGRHHRLGAIRGLKVKTPK